MRILMGGVYLFLLGLALTVGLLTREDNGDE